MSLPSFRITLLAGLAAGAIAMIPAQAYAFAYTATTGLRFAEITPASIVFASLVPGILAGIGYAVALRWIPRGRTVFQVGVLVFGIGSGIPFLFAPPHPGFGGMAAPLHTLVALVLAFGIPPLTDRLDARARQGSPAAASP